MGYCKDCYYAERISGNFNLFCSILEDKPGRMATVSRFGSCNHFEPRSTKNNSGYKDGCFLTAACVEYLGKPDDCEELQALRNFRNSYMLSTEDGRALVEEYYKIAPKIVEKIDASGEKDKYYGEIYKTVTECCKQIADGNYDETLRLYKNMTLELKKEFLQGGEL